jgi:formate dehydrogenase assembly factor FdhD
MKGFILYYKTIHKFSDIEKWDEEKQDAETEFEITVVMQNQPVYDDYLQYITSSSNRVHDEESLKQYQRQLRAIVQRAIDAVEPAELQKLGRVLPYATLFLHGSDTEGHEPVDTRQMCTKNDECGVRQP